MAVIQKKKKDKKKSIQTIDTVDLDPRKQAFAAAYLNPESNTYSNALQSGLKAGFSQEYSESILFQKPKWLMEILGKQDFLDIARKNLKRDLTADIYSYTTKGRGKDKKKVKLGINSKVMKNVQDATFFVMNKLDRDFKEKDKDDPNPQTVVITQIIIKNPDGSSIVYDANQNPINGNIANAEAGGGVQEAS